jgi:5-methylcytosine-specific restriction protein B
MRAFEELIEGMAAGRAWGRMGDSDGIRELLWRVYAERCHGAAHHRERYQLRVNMQKAEDAASYAGWIPSENPSSGPYEGTSFVWFPGQGGSVAILGIGTNGFGSDAHILGRPGHARRLRALARLHRGAIWVKPDVLDLSSPVPPVVTQRWPGIEAALRSYERVVYAAVAVRGTQDARAVEDLLDLFFDEHQTPLTGEAKRRWEKREKDIHGAIFPHPTEGELQSLLRERRFLVLEGPPGTGKTRLAFRLAGAIGSHTAIQFHPARTYEDFVVGLFPEPVREGLAFRVKAGDLLSANEAARTREHVLVLDELNRADLARVLGEAIVLFEVGESSRAVRLAHAPEGHPAELRLNPQLYVLGTRNTADRTIARMDLAIRRRFAFVPIWPDPAPVRAQEVELAGELFDDVLATFVEYADEETLRLVPGHAYFLDPRPELGGEHRAGRVARRLRLELLPLLREYLSDRLCGAASETIAGLADRVEARLLELA